MTTEIPPFPEWGDDRGEARHVFEAACQQGSRNVYVGNSTVLAKVLGHYYMYLQATDASIASHLMLNGYWESWLTLGLRSCLRPGMVVADVGANHGYYSLMMAEIVGDKGKVFAFEPQADIFGLLQRTIIANGLDGRVTAFNLAVGGHNGTANLTVPQFHTGGATINSTFVDDQIKVPGLDERTVEATTLDAALAEHVVDLVKIDVEGAEALVFAGMSQLIARNPRIQIAMEIQPRLDAQQLVLSALENDGFDVFAINYSGELHNVPYDYVRGLPFDPMLIFRRPDSAI